MADDRRDRLQDLPVVVPPAHTAITIRLRGANIVIATMTNEKIENIATIVNIMTATSTVIARFAANTSVTDSPPTIRAVVVAQNSMARPVRRHIILVANMVALNANVAGMKAKRLITVRHNMALNIMARPVRHHIILVAIVVALNANVADMKAKRLTMVHHNMALNIMAHPARLHIILVANMARRHALKRDTVAINMIAPNANVAMIDKRLAVGRITISPIIREI